MKRTLLAVIVVTLLVITSSGLAKTELGLNAVGARVGFVMPEDPIDNTIAFGGHVDLGTLMPQLTLHGYVDYWSKSYGEGQYYDVSFSVLGIHAIVKYHFESSGNIQPYIGGGLGLNIGSSSVDYSGPYKDLIGDTNTSNSDSELGLNILGGATMPLSPTMDGFAELRYNTGGVDYFGVYVGISYKLK